MANLFMKIHWNNFSVYVISKFGISRILDEIFNIFLIITFCYKKFKTITFFNTIIFKNLFLGNFAYQIEIKNTYQIFFNKERKKIYFKQIKM